MYDADLKKFCVREWSTVKVGELLRVTKERPLIPADIFVLKSSGKDGICYLETKSLDGETNLKMKRPHSHFCNLYETDNDLASVGGTVTCDPPNN